MKTRPATSGDAKHMSNAELDSAIRELSEMVETLRNERIARQRGAEGNAVPTSRSRELPDVDLDSK